ncbi:hypothetical protein JTB14_005938 [Gonioctena quinquepunctata]|nr:hypothetical protein JTB14_005938 [Gonioctena quinquepunctata]
MGANNKFINLERLENNPDELFDFLDDVGSDLEIEGTEEETENFDISYLDEQKVLQENILSERTPLESDSDREDNIPLSHFQKASWKKMFFSQNQILWMTLLCEILSLWQYFNKYLNDHPVLPPANWKGANISSEDIKKFFGLHAIMGATNFPTIHMYWNANFKFPLISNVMPHDKFYLLRMNFHVVDDLAVDDEMRKNKLWKVQPMIDLVKNRCHQIQRKPNASTNR